MFLEYLALAILLIVLVAVFYTFIYIHDLPHEIAKHRKHPHTEAIHVACWLSLFTLHAIWPIVYIWAVSKPKPVEGTADGHAPEAVPAGNTPADPKLAGVAAGVNGGTDLDLAHRVRALEEQLRILQASPK